MPHITYSVRPDGTHTLIGPRGTHWDWPLYATHFPGRAELAEHRRAIDPDRFDHHHPYLAWLMTSTPMPPIPDLPDIPTAPVPIAPVPGIPGVPAPPHRPPAAIPEPGTLTLWCVGLAIVAAWIAARGRGK